MAKEVPIWGKANLTIEEAAAYSGIGTGKLREITNNNNCNILLWVDNKRLIKNVCLIRSLKRHLLFSICRLVIEKEILMWYDLGITSSLLLNKRRYKN